jgi:hypothetical protein
MRNKILLAVILILPPVLFLFFWLTPGVVKMPPAGQNQTQTDQDAVVAKALATANPKAAAIIASNFAGPQQTVFYSVPPKPAVMPAGKPAPLEFTNMAPDTVLDKVRHVIHDYDSMFGGNPVGNNAEITSQLNCNNPKQANFIQPEDGMRSNGEGELVDPWGTPYFFHQLSGKEMEIRSAGPDKIMWTADDLVTE